MSYSENLEKLCYKQQWLLLSKCKTGGSIGIWTGLKFERKINHKLCTQTKIWLTIVDQIQNYLNKLCFNTPENWLDRCIIRVIVEIVYKNITKQWLGLMLNMLKGPMLKVLTSGLWSSVNLKWPTIIKHTYRIRS